MKKIIFAAVTAAAMFAMSDVAEARRFSQNTQYSHNSGLIAETDPVGAIFGSSEERPGWTYDSTQGWQMNPTPRFKSMREARRYHENFHRPVHTAFHSESVHGFLEHTLGAPSSSIVAYGHMLQEQGYRVSEHPAFGGVHHVHAHHSAHYSGRAIDINVGRGVVEARSAYAQRFDQLAAQARAAGYKVLWRVAGHYDHIHLQY